MKYKSSTLAREGEWKISDIFYCFFMTVMCFFNTLSYLSGIYEYRNPLLSFVFHTPIYLVFGCLPVLAFLIVFHLRMKSDVLLVTILFIGGLLFTISAFPQNMEYVSPLYFSFIYAFTILWLMRLVPIDAKRLISTLVMTSRVLFFVVLITTLVTRAFLDYENYMNYSDATTMITCILIFSGIVNKNKIDLILAVISTLFLLILGGRGAVSSVVIFVILVQLFKPQGNKKFVAFLLFCSLFILIFQNEILSFIRTQNWGGRVFSTLASNSFLDDSSRFLIYDTLYQELMKHPWTGIGLCGDRYLLPFYFKEATNGSYAHNIVLEILLDFGFLVGTIFILYILKLIIFDFILNKNISYELKSFICIFFVVGFVQLLTSRTYLTEKSFFILLALLMNVSNKKQIIKWSV